MATQPSEEERQVGNERPPQNSNSENELADSSDREDYFFKTLIDSSDSDFDDAAREEIDRYDKMMNETQGFGVTFRPDYPFLGGVYPIDFNIEPERAELVRQYTLYAIDHHNRTKDGSLQFVDLLHATYGPTGGITYYITFRAFDSKLNATNTYEARVHYLRRDKKEVELFRLKPKRKQKEMH